MQRYKNKLIFLVGILLLQTYQSLADCRGCCSRHGGVCCIGNVTMCCDGSSLSITCQAKGCSICSTPISNPSNDIENQTVKVRLYGIDCPESKQLYGKEATQFTKNLVLNKNVSVEKKDIDYYGRIVGLVYLQDGRILNKLLVENGYAWVYDIYCQIPECNDWKYLEEKAKNEKVGLWSDPNPIPPWDFRQLSASYVLSYSVPSLFSGRVVSVADGDTLTVEISSAGHGSSNQGSCSMGNSNLSFAIYGILLIAMLIKRKIIKSKKLKS